MGSVLADMFRKKVSEMKDYNMSNEAKEETGYTTGYLPLDYLNGYMATEMNPETGKTEPYYSLGITDGSYNAFIGNTGTGKSTLVAQIAANIVRPFKTSMIFEDSIEGGLTTPRRMSLSRFSDVGYKERYIIRNTGINAENFYKRIKMIHDMKTQHPEEFIYNTGRKDLYGNPIMKLEPTVYIIDSIAILMPEKYTDEDELAGKSMGAASALIVTNVFKTILPMLKAANIILFGINHILEDVNMTAMPKKTSVPGLKQGERMPKGRTVTYLANNIFRLDHAGKLKEDEGYKFNGSLVDVSMVKSRNSGHKTSVRLVFDYNNGFDPWISLLRFMQDRKLLYGGGVSMSFDPEKRFKFSQASFRQQIFDDPEFRAEFIKAVLPHLKGLVSGKDVSAIDNHVEDLLNVPDLYSV
nr:MAG TPA: Protein recA [Caudoviricetes sp.]